MYSHDEGMCTHTQITQGNAEKVAKREHTSNNQWIPPGEGCGGRGQRRP